jgi:hypothetical protein
MGTILCLARMTGGKGADTFLFFASSVGNGIGKDHITDYEIGVDHVELHQFLPE